MKKPSLYDNWIYNSSMQIRFLLEGHLFNWLWLTPEARKFNREKAFMRLKLAKLHKYIAYIKGLGTGNRATEGEKRNIDDPIFMMWLQGEEDAPYIVRKCIESVRRFYPERLIFLDSRSLSDFITLPSYIEEKYRQGLIIPAHYADIIRIELLSIYGGYWIDATCLLTGQIPDYIEKTDFFMYVTSRRLNYHMFVHNCFIRAKKNDPLLLMWRNVVREYWRQENRAKAYYLVHYLLKLLVTYNGEARSLFDEMPKCEADPMHYLWEKAGNKPFDKENYESMTQNSFLHKCTYKSHKGWVNEIITGSMADYAINGSWT